MVMQLHVLGICYFREKLNWIYTSDKVLLSVVVDQSTCISNVDCSLFLISRENPEIDASFFKVSDGFHDTVL